MTLREILRRQEGALREEWLASILASYPADSARFLRGEKDGFANPVGQTFARATGALLGELLSEKPGDGRDLGVRMTDLRAHLDPIVKIRSIQGFTASQAVSLFYELKVVLRRRLEAELASDAVLLRELLELELEIDSFALLAFDLFVGCRESLCEVRVNELKRSVHTLLRRAQRGEPPAGDAGARREDEEDAPVTDGRTESRS
jgi:hypothetical protein